MSVLATSHRAAKHCHHTFRALPGNAYMFASRFDFRLSLHGPWPRFAASTKAKFNSTLSSGSIEGVGLQASEPQNLGVACGFMAEGSKWIEWLLNESGVNRSICTELYERFSNGI